MVRASHYYEDSLQAHRRAGNRRGVAQSLVYLGVAAYWQGDFARAAQVTQEGLTIMRDLRAGKPRHGRAQVG